MNNKPEKKPKKKKIPKKIPIDNFQFRVVNLNGKKSIELKSRTYFQHFLNTKTEVGNIGTMTIKVKKPTRSANQLNYYAVIVGLIADYTGDTWDDVHSALMILNWGTHTVMGVEVRKSVSDVAQIKKNDMSEQIEFALSEAKKLGIVVPTREELGYISN
jgi:GTP cyclohydrolase II